MLEFNDPQNWLSHTIETVKTSYKIPSNINNNGIAVDVGSNVGAFPIVNSKHFKSVHCIEPSLSTINECKKNTAHLDNIFYHKYAVSNIDGKQIKLKSFRGSNYSGNASVLDHVAWDDSKFELVDTISLKGIFNKLGVNQIEYMKVDCEGSEYDLLMDQDLSKINYIGIELHLQLGEKMLELKEYLLKYFDVIYDKGE